MPAWRDLRLPGSWQSVRYPVHLDEMKPEKNSPAHHEDTFAELVCSNSLRSNALTNAVGLLKEEMRTIGSLIMAKADENQVPAGSALAVDRERFSQAVTDAINSHPNITVVHEEVDHIPDEPCVIATGPLSSQAMVEAIRAP